MAKGSFDVLIGTDGSGPARAAVAAAVAFPWPASSQGHAVIAQRGFLGPADAEWPVSVWTALETTLQRLARATRQALARRWPDAEVTLVDASPVEAILSRARAVRADAIVVGSRGHGMLGRLLLGSVSRGVVRRATCPVLVVKGRLRSAQRVVVGIDGSASSRRAVQMLARLRPPSGGHAIALAVLEPTRMPSLGFLPAPVRGAVSRQAAAETARLRREARRAAETAVSVLRRGGWRAEASVTQGNPASELAAAAGKRGVEMLVLGARGTGGVERLLLGSVAEGALSRSPVSVLIVR